MCLYTEKVMCFVLWKPSAAPSVSLGIPMLASWTGEPQLHAVRQRNTPWRLPGQIKVGNSEGTTGRYYSV